MERILITGASRGIGRAIAVELASPNRNLLIHGRDLRALEETADYVHRKGGRTELIPCDLASLPDLERMTQEIARQPLHGMIHNAGVAYVKSAVELTLDNWHRTFAVNVTAPFWLTRKLLPIMPAGSSIVNILSTAARTPFPNWSSYCMSKFALDGFMRSVREETRAKGIRIINIYPAATSTDIWNRVPGEWPRDHMLSPEQTAQAVAYALSRPASVQVEEITLGSIGGAL